MFLFAENNEKLKQTFLRLIPSSSVILALNFPMFNEKQEAFSYVLKMTKRMGGKVSEKFEGVDKMAFSSASLRV